MNWSTAYDQEKEDRRWQAKRHKPEEIVAKLRQVEVLVGQGMARIDAIREIRITEQTYYRWRKRLWRYGHRSTQRAEASPEGE